MSEVVHKSNLRVKQHCVRASIFGQRSHAETGSSFPMAEKLDRQCWSKERFQKEPDCRAFWKELQFPSWRQEWAMSKLHGNFLGADEARQVEQVDLSSNASNQESQDVGCRDVTRAHVSATRNQTSEGTQHLHGCGGHGCCREDDLDDGSDCHGPAENGVSDFQLVC